MLSQAGSYGDQDLLARARELFEQHLHDREAVPRTSEEWFLP